MAALRPTIGRLDNVLSITISILFWGQVSHDPHGRDLCSCMGTARIRHFRALVTHTSIICTFIITICLFIGQTCIFLYCNITPCEPLYIEMEPAERPNETIVSILCFTAESKVCERNKSPVWVLDCHPVPELPIKYELQDSEETEKSNAPSHLPRGPRPAEESRT
jgi:hypothetical protein